MASFSSRPLPRGATTVFSFTDSLPSPSQYSATLPRAVEPAPSARPPEPAATAGAGASPGPEPGDQTSPAPNLDRNLGMDPALVERLNRLAAMSPDLRTPLHGLLGYAQLLRMEGRLDNVQSLRVDAILAAGTHLLEKIFALLTLLDGAMPPPVSATPSTAATLPGAMPAIGEIAVGQRRPLRVLVADDIDMNREIAAAFLRPAGHEVTLAEDGDEALEAAANHDFDVILLDLRMPGMDGLQAARQIRALPSPRGRTPILAVTSLALPEQIEECRRAGMNGHLARPFRHDTLNDAIMKAAAGATPPHPVAAARAAGPGASLGVRESWIETRDPWSRIMAAAASHAPAQACAAEYHLKLTPIGVRNGKPRLIGASLSCAPPVDGDQHEYHWLFYTNAPANNATRFKARCDLWRWNRGAWQSVTVPGAAFGPWEMFEQGWRYCGPCEDATASVEIA